MYIDSEAHIDLFWQIPKAKTLIYKVKSVVEPHWLILFSYIVGTALLLIVANWSGIGWSWDSTDYVSAGRAISHSLGPLDVTAQPMTVRTPGYPALIAIGEWLNLPTNFTLVAITALCASIVTGCTFNQLKNKNSEVGSQNGGRGGI